MEFLYRFCRITQPEIGKLLGGIDYSAVSHARKRMVIKIHDDMSKAIERAHSSKEIANAITTFSAGLIALKPELLKIQEKYPELNNEETIPQELKSLMGRTLKRPVKMQLEPVESIYGI